ncbi:MAG: fasciclin domain-containing protein [Gemmatimonadota bacterium]|jgi:uncharacterized surface protein with fasciclin (FAS1) repeats
MRAPRLLTAALAMAIMTTSVLACDDDDDGPVGVVSDPNIVEVAVSAGDFETLVAAVTAAGLVETLSGPGPFTVFAPTDAAFAKLPAGTVEDLLRPENLAQLQEILTYHVVADEVRAAQVVQLNAATTIQGDDVAIAVNDGVVSVNDATVLQTDIGASNGVIHVIDTVLLPPAPAE